MYQISRAIYRELAPYVSDADGPSHGGCANANQTKVLHSCEAVIERLAKDPYCFADPTRTLFYDIRGHFPMGAQQRVHHVVSFYMDIAQRFIAEHPIAGYAAVCGEAPRCRATTRKGEACRRIPLPQNGYCPSHQHLAETEDRELPRFKFRAMAAHQAHVNERERELTEVGADAREREHEQQHARERDDLLVAV